MTGSYDGAVIGERFQLERAPTLLTRTASVAPIGFTRLRREAGGRVRAKDVPYEAAWSFHVALAPTAVDLWIDGKPTLSTTARPGATFLFDLGSNPVSELDGAFDILRFYISQASLDELAFERGVRGSVRFAPTPLGGYDRTMHGLASALADHLGGGAGHSALFVDYVGLAFHAHATQTYGQAATPVATGGLSPWQLRRATTYMTEHLDGDPTIAELAAECGLSVGHFARAFRRTTGTTPHQWLMARRVGRARDLMLRSGQELAQIAAACGFGDQSHFNRVFNRIEGMSPGRWRRANR